MITRRRLIISAAAGLLAAAMPHAMSAADDPADKTVRYDLVQENGQWKIDDIRGAVDGSPWSVRALLAASLK